jgi:catechol 2,3-dioxygenase-like lactoylglutathione lyase family enzyme
MDLTIHQTFLPYDDPDASLAFYRDNLGFEVRNHVEYNGMHWITLGPAHQPDTSIVLHPPGVDPGITDDERRTIAEMMAKSRSTSRTGFATAPSAIPRATCCASKSCAKPSWPPRRRSGRPRRTLPTATS